MPRGKPANGVYTPRAVVPLKLRFWRQVKPQVSGCWEWQGCIDSTGYGRIGRGRATAGNVHTHRLSYELIYGAIPDGMCVCHTCDNRKCVRPDHLWLGTRADNNRDMFAKGRGRYGANWTADAGV